MRGATNRGPDGRREGGGKNTGDLLEEQNIPVRKWIQRNEIYFLIYWISPPPFSLSTHILTVTRIDAGP